MRVSWLKICFEWCIYGLRKHVLLVFVEIAGNPGHCDDEREDGEAYDEE